MEKGELSQCNTQDTPDGNERQQSTKRVFILFTPNKLLLLFASCVLIVLRLDATRSKMADGSERGNSKSALFFYLSSNSLLASFIFYFCNQRLPSVQRCFALFM